MAVYRRSNRSRFTLLLLILTSVTVLTLDQRGGGAKVLDTVKSGVRDVFAPVQDATDAVVSPVTNFFRGVVSHGRLEEENAQLRDEIEELRGQQLEAADAERERKALLEQADLPFVGDIATLKARVVSTSPSSFELTVELNRGTADGVAEGMPVVTGSGLAGRVVQASRQRSTVVLLTDREFDVGVRESVTGDVGVASGRGRGKHLSVDLIDPTTPMEKGQVLTTSGLQQSRFPPGIPVGIVTSAKVQPGALSQEVLIEPVVDVSRLDLVTVLLWSPT